MEELDWGAAFPFLSLSLYGGNSSFNCKCYINRSNLICNCFYRNNLHMADYPHKQSPVSPHCHLIQEIRKEGFAVSQ